jgi:nucleoporin SEH1/centrosomal protein CEP192
MLAVGSDDTNPSAGGKVQIHEYHDDSRYMHYKFNI